MLKGWQLIEIIAGMVRKMHCQPSSNHHAERLTWRMSHSAYPLIVPLAYSHLFSFGREMTAAMVIKANPERAHGAHGHGVQVYAAPVIFAMCIASHRTASDFPSTRTRHHVGDRCGWSDRERKKSKHKKNKKTKRGGEHRTNQMHVLIVVLLRPCAAVNRWWSWLPVCAVLPVVYPVFFILSVSQPLSLIVFFSRPLPSVLRLSPSITLTILPLLVPNHTSGQLQVIWQRSQNGIRIWKIFWKLFLGRGFEKSLRNEKETLAIHLPRLVSWEKQERRRCNFSSRQGKKERRC